MADTIQPDSTIAAADVVAAETTGNTATSEVQTGGVDTTGTPLAIVAQQATPDPNNPTYLEKLKAAGL
jgi:hypothetical protein